MRLVAMLLTLLTACSPAPVPLPTATRPPATATPQRPTATLSAPTATLRPVLRFPLDMPAQIDTAPAYTIRTSIRRDAARRQRWELDVDVPESYGKDEMVAVLRHAALWGLSAYPDTNALLVWAFTLPRNPSAGWTGEARVSRDGKGWSASDADDGTIHITYAPLLDPTYKIDLSR